MSRRRQMPSPPRLVDVGRATSRGALGVAALIAVQTDGSDDVDRVFITLFVAAGLAPILVDPAAVTMASSPTCRRRRIVHRLVWIAPGLAGWAVLQWIVAADSRRVVPPRWAWLELSTSLAVVLAAEIISARSFRATGLSGVGALLCVTAMTYAVSYYVAIVPVAEHELRFASIGAVALIVCWCASSDSALRVNRAHRSPRQVGQQEPISEGTCKGATVG
jgi:hypothetical protein